MGQGADAAQHFSEAPRLEPDHQDAREYLRRLEGSKAVLLLTTTP
jgi:hypothetical protein